MKNTKKWLWAGVLLVVVITAAAFGNTNLFQGKFGPFQKKIDPKILIQPISDLELRCPDAPIPIRTVTRAELSRMLVDALNLTPFIPAKPHFSDVPSDSWFFSSVETVYNAGILQGYPDGTFHPERIINRAEFAAVINRSYPEVMDASTTPGTPQFSDAIPSWADAYVKHLYTSGAVQVKFRPEDALERSFAEEVFANLAD